MLKTAVLVMTQEGLDDQDSLLEPIEFTCRIYRKLLQFLEKDKRIPNFFLNPSNSETGECIFRIEKNREHIREMECWEMIKVVKTILNALERVSDLLSVEQIYKTHNYERAQTPLRFLNTFIRKTLDSKNP